MPELAMRPSPHRLEWWQWAWLLLAGLSLPPVVYHAYQASQQVDRELRVRLIQRYSLWESDPNYQGTPQTWTRFAAMLLTTEQLMQRMRDRQGAIAEQIEQDYRRDAALAHGGVIAQYVLGWAAPLGLLYGAGWLCRQRNRRPPPPASRTTAQNTRTRPTKPARP